MFDKLKLNIREAIESGRLKSKKNVELRELNREEKFEKQVDQLDKEIELEQRKAELRALKATNIPLTPVKESGLKGAFGKFQDFAAEFANNQAAQTNINGRKKTYKQSSWLEPTIEIEGYKK